MSSESLKKSFVQRIDVFDGFFNHLHLFVFINEMRNAIKSQHTRQTTESIYVRYNGNI